MQRLIRLYRERSFESLVGPGNDHLCDLVEDLNGPRKAAQAIVFGAIGYDGKFVYSTSTAHHSGGPPRRCSPFHVSSVGGTKNTGLDVPFMLFIIGL